MNKLKILSLIAAGVAFGSIEAKVFDAHIMTPEEEHMCEKADRDRENEKNWETLYDEDASYSDKLEALDSLEKNGEIA